VGLAEISDAMALWTRELELYQDEKFHQLIIQGYQHMLESARICIEVMQRKGTSTILATISTTFRSRFEKRIIEMQKISDKIVREVDYRHRVEMREASRKIAVMHVEQQKIASMLQNQKNLLETMQQERKIMDVVHEQQKILQIVQQIQLRMHAQAGDRTDGYCSHPLG